jgi:O-antigen chain-terminating methyltransferase
VESAELVAILREVRDRVRARYPEATGAAANGVDERRIPVADLMPLVHARDAALGKVAAIGTVNPRRGGPVNWAVQTWKRMLARMLDWHVREQVEFNRKIVTCIDTAIEALNDNNRAFMEVTSRLAEIQAQFQAEFNEFKPVCEELREEARQLKDVRSHWAEWRLDWERKLAENEIQFLRSVADLQGGFQHRSTMMEVNFREQVRGQHAEFTAALERQAIELQKKMWADFERIRVEYERVIHGELRTVRQRQVGHVGQTLGPARQAEPPAPPRPAFDYLHFAEKFRGPEEYVKAGQQQYVPLFSVKQNVLDIGCGRGEFLETMRDAGVAARGIDLNEEQVALCRSKGLAAGKADLFAYLEGLPESSLDGIFCSQVVEHLPPERLPDMIRLCASRLDRDGVIAIETPNPECLAIFATHFYLDPTHTRPVPHPLLAFYLEESGIGRIEVRRLSPAVESMPALAALPDEFREAFFGGLDYAITGRKL